MDIIGQKQLDSLGDEFDQWVAEGLSGWQAIAKKPVSEEDIQRALNQLGTPEPMQDSSENADSSLKKKEIQDFTASVQPGEDVSDHPFFSNSTLSKVETPKILDSNFIKTEVTTPVVDLASCPYKVNELPKFLNAVYSGVSFKEKPVQDFTFLPNPTAHNDSVCESVVEPQLQDVDGKVSDAFCPYSGKNSGLPKWLNILYGHQPITEEKLDREDENHSAHNPFQEAIEELSEKLWKISQGLVRAGYQNTKDQLLQAEANAYQIKGQLHELWKITKALAHAGCDSAKEQVLQTESQIRQLVKDLEIEKNGAKALAVSKDALQKALLGAKDALAKTVWQEPSFKSWIPKKPSGTECEYLPRSKENWYQAFTKEGNSSYAPYFKLKEEKEPPICYLHENAVVGENLGVCGLHENAVLPDTLENIPFRKEPAKGEWKVWKDHHAATKSDDAGTCDSLYANAAQSEPLDTCQFYPNAAQSHLKKLPLFFQSIWNEEPSLKSQMIRKALGTKLGYTPRKNWYDVFLPKTIGNTTTQGSPYFKVNFHFDHTIGRPTALAVTSNDQEMPADVEIPLVKYQLEGPSMETAINLIRQTQVEAGEPPVTSVAVAGQDPVAIALRKLDQLAKEGICKPVDTTAVAVLPQELCKPLTEKMVNIVPPKAEDSWMPKIEVPVESNKAPSGLALVGQDSVAIALRKLHQIAKQEICKPVDTTAVATLPQEMCKPLTETTVEVLNLKSKNVLGSISTPALKEQSSTELAVMYPSVQKIDSTELFKPLKVVNLELDHQLSQNKTVIALEQNGTCQNVDLGHTPFSIAVPLILAAATIAFTGYQAGKWLWKRYSSFKQAEALKEQPVVKKETTSEVKAPEQVVQKETEEQSAMAKWVESIHQQILKAEEENLSPQSNLAVSNR